MSEKEWTERDYLNALGSQHEEISRLKEELEKAKQVCLAIDAMSNQNENMEFAIIKLLEELEKAKDQIKKCRECPEVEHNCEECDYMKVPRGKP